MHPEDLQFIVDVFTKERLAVQAARHKYPGRKNRPRVVLRLAC